MSTCGFCHTVYPATSPACPNCNSPTRNSFAPPAPAAHVQQSPYAQPAPQYHQPPPQAYQAPPAQHGQRPAGYGGGGGGGAPAGYHQAQAVQRREPQSPAELDTHFGLFLDRSNHPHGLLFNTRRDGGALVIDAFRSGPNGEKGDLEKCGLVAPGDELVLINNVPVSTVPVSSLGEHIRAQRLFFVFARPNRAASPQTVRVDRRRHPYGLLFDTCRTHDKTRAVLSGFRRGPNGEMGALEQSGLVSVGDELYAIDGQSAVGQTDAWVRACIESRPVLALTFYARYQRLAGHQSPQPQGQRPPQYQQQPQQPMPTPVVSVQLDRQQHPHGLLFDTTRVGSVVFLTGFRRSPSGASGALEASNARLGMWMTHVNGIRTDSVPDQQLARIITSGRMVALDFAHPPPNMRVPELSYPAGGGGGGSGAAPPAQASAASASAAAPAAAPAPAVSPPAYNYGEGYTPVSSTSQQYEGSTTSNSSNPSAPPME